MPYFIIFISIFFSLPLMSSDRDCRTYEGEGRSFEVCVGDERIVDLKNIGYNISQPYARGARVLAFEAGSTVVLGRQIVVSMDGQLFRSELIPVLARIEDLGRMVGLLEGVGAGDFYRNSQGNAVRIAEVISLGQGHPGMYLLESGELYRANDEY